jgi:hypothetical protein
MGKVCPADNENSLFVLIVEYNVKQNIKPDKFRKMFPDKWCRLKNL